MELLKILTPENPKVITFDILFNTNSKGMSFNQLNNLQREIANEPSFENKLKIYQDYTKNYASLTSHPSDNEFAEELKKHSNIVLLGAIIDEIKKADFPLPKFIQNHEVGITYDNPDRDGILRAVKPSFIHPQTKKQYDDLAIATVKKYLGESHSGQAATKQASSKNPESKIQNLPLENGKLLVNFFGDPFSFKEISFVDVLNKNFDTGTFTNKIVLVGVTTLKEGQDRVLTPRSNAIPMTGIEFRANEMQTILEGKFLQNQKTASLILMIFVIGFGLAILFIYTGIMVSFIGLLIGLGGYYFSAHLAYKSGLILNMVYPFIAILLAYIFAWIYRYFIADKKKREITSAFSHYVSEDLVEQISKNPDAVKLGGEKKVITVFFTDLKDSTALSEKTEITSWISQLNEYFTVMEKVIKHFGGTIDKYEGDAIMGFWNAPIADPDHILKGYMAAIEMKKYLKILNVKWAKDGRPTLQMRIGINTGEAIVGNMGSTGRFDYTAMGDTVNVASRLESCASKVYGGIVAVLGFEKFGNAEELKKKIVLREIDTVILPGKKDPMTIWEAVCGKQELTTEIQNNLQNYEKGLSAYRSKDFTSAENYFTSCANDPVAGVMLERVKNLADGKPIKNLSENMIFIIGNK